MASDCEKSHLFEELLQSNHKFTSDTYKILADDGEDLIFSPISLQIALLLAYSGAYGETAEEMKKGLSLSKEKEEVLQGAQLLLQTLKNPNLKIASKIFIEQKYGLKSSYEDVVKKYLESAFQTVDFKKAASKAIEIINSWVFEKTEKKISDLIAPNSLNEYTRLVLVNAVHFKDDWLNEFSENGTYEEPFYTSKNSSVNIPMMHITKKFNYLEENLYKVIELPYKNKAERFVILLPKENDGLRNLEEKLFEIEFSKLLQNLEPRKVHLTLPKMKMEKFTDMKSTLTKLGMKTMFGDDADFSEMYARGEDPLYVSDVLHKAVLEVNEKGSEAAAASAVKMMMKRSLLIDEEEPVEFKVDHPFIFLILHGNVILFIGKKVGAA